MSYIALWVADRLGFFRDEGITVNFSQVLPAVSVNATVSGDLDYVSAYGSTVRGAATGLPLQAIAVYADKPLDTLISVPSITSIADLAGKRIGVDQIGVTTDLLTREVLRRRGFDPARAQFVVAGDESARLQQLLVGQIDAAMIGPQGRVEAERAGLRVLAVGSEVVQLPLGGLGTSDKKLAEKRDEVIRVLRASMRGQQVLLTNRAEALKTLQEVLKLDPDVASRVYDISLPSYSRTGAVTDDIVNFDLNLARQAGAQIPANPPLDDVRDFSLVVEISRQIGLSQ